MIDHRSSMILYDLQLLRLVIDDLQLAICIDDRLQFADRFQFADQFRFAIGNLSAIKDLHAITDPRLYIRFAID